MTSPEPGPVSPDLELGAFSEHGPWVVDPDAMPWRQGLDAIRAHTRLRVPELLEVRTIPPLERRARVLTAVGAAVASWYARERGTTRSRRGISRRLRVAFGNLGSTFVKLGQIVSAGEGIFPEELVSEFRLCRDEVPAETFEDVQRVIEEDFGRPMGTFFREFVT